MIIATGNFPGTPAVMATQAFALSRTIAMSLVALRRGECPIFTETELEPAPGHYKDMLRLPF